MQLLDHAEVDAADGRTRFFAPLLCEVVCPGLHSNIPEANPSFSTSLFFVRAPVRDGGANCCYWPLTSRSPSNTNNLSHRGGDVLGVCWGGRTGPEALAG